MANSSNINSNAHHKSPRELCLEGNVSENWRKFQQRFGIFMTATKGYNETDEVQIATLLSFVGDDALEAYNTFQFASDSEKGNLKAVLEKFEQYCAPRKNVVYERFKFFSIVQKSGQTFEQFFLELKRASQTCEFSDQTESLVRDRIVLGISDKNTQERLLRDNQLTLQKAANFCRSSEESQKQAKAVQEIVTVDAFAQANRESYAKVSSKPITARNQDTYDCKKCGYRHKKFSCPAFGKKCSNCNKDNHFAKGCPKRQEKRNVHAVEKKMSQSQQGSTRQRSGREEGSTSDEDEDPNQHNASLYISA